jgi:hypothetical protein
VAFDWRVYRAIDIGIEFRLGPLADDIRSQFSTIEDAGAIVVERLGKPVDTYSIYIARAYAPSTQ